MLLPPPPSRVRTLFFSSSSSLCFCRTPARARASSCCSSQLLGPPKRRKWPGSAHLVGSFLGLDGEALVHGCRLQGSAWLGVLRHAGGLGAGFLHCCWVLLVAGVLGMTMSSWKSSNRASGGPIRLLRLTVTAMARGSRQRKRPPHPTTTQPGPNASTMAPRAAIPLREIVYTLSPYNQHIVAQGVANLPGKITKYFKNVSAAVAGPAVGPMHCHTAANSPWCCCRTGQASSSSTRCFSAPSCECRP